MKKKEFLLARVFLSQYTSWTATKLVSKCRPVFPNLMAMEIFGTRKIFKESLIQYLYMKLESNTTKE
jgi:hypothetical protein